MALLFFTLRLALISRQILSDSALPEDAVGRNTSQTTRGGGVAGAPQATANQLTPLSPSPAAGILISDAAFSLAMAAAQKAGQGQ